VASGEQGVPVAAAVQTVIVGPATGCPPGPKTMSSLREPCASAAGAAMVARVMTARATSAMCVIVFMEDMNGRIVRVRFIAIPSQEICSRSAAGRAEVTAPAAIVTSVLLGECDHSSTGIPPCANVTTQRDR